MAMNEDYVSYELAVKLKAAGFDSVCRYYYTKRYSNNAVVCLSSKESPTDYNKKPGSICSMPTLWQAQKWLREKHHISIRVSYISYHKVWFADWLNLDSGEFDDTDATFDTYEQALSAGITFVLELITKGE